MASDYGEGIINRLHPNSPLRHEGNPARSLIMKTIGAWLDNYDVTELYDGNFLDTATGRWLDLHGRDLGVPRNLDEGDDDYRTRLIYASIGNLSIDYFMNVFDLPLYSFRDDFDVSENTLVSDNPFLNVGGYLSVADEGVINILDNKFLLGSSITWITDSTAELEYIINLANVNVLGDYKEVYNLTDLHDYFNYNYGIKSVKLRLSKATTNTGIYGIFSSCANLEFVELDVPNLNTLSGAFQGCSSLTRADINAPNSIYCNYAFYNCTNLTNVRLNIPKLDGYGSMFNGASNIKTIDVTIPSTKVSGFKSYVDGLNLQQLTSFIINGEEQL